MIKGIALKSLEAYIYSSVILPLKGLRDGLNYPSPIVVRGETFSFNVQRRALLGSYRRNYQREVARAKLPLEIVLSSRYTAEIVGEYSEKSHQVILYKKPFKQHGLEVVLNKIHSLMYTNTPFTKVRMMSEYIPPANQDERYDSDIDYDEPEEVVF